MSTQALNTKHSSSEWIWIDCLHENPCLQKEQLCICWPISSHFGRDTTYLFWWVYEYCTEAGMILIESKQDKTHTHTHSTLKTNNNKKKLSKPEWMHEHFRSLRRTQASCVVLDCWVTSPKCSWCTWLHCLAL